MKYALITTDNLSWHPDIALYKDPTAAITAMKKYFTDDLRVELLRAGIAADPALVDPSEKLYRKYFDISIQERSIHIEIRATGDVFHYEIIEV